MRRTIALAAALAAFSLSAACGEELTEGDRKLFKWFDGLGFANLAGLKYVRVGTGNWNRHGDDPPQNRYVRGFLLADAGDTFRVLHMDLSVQTYTRTGPGVSEHQRVHFTELDLQKEAEALLANLKRIHSSEERDHWRRFGARLSERSEVFILARACAAKGHDRIARQLLDFAAAMPERRTGEPPKKTLQSVLEDEIGHAEMWRAVLAFGDASVGRKALLGRFAGIVRSYPNSQHIQRAKDTVKLLKQMVAEDDERAKAKRKSTAEMTPKERIADLIFRLRDQNGQQWSQPGACDIFNDERGEESPAHQLVKIGYPAVPQLIEVLDDRRFTRSVGYHRDFYFSHYVLRVGDCANSIIQRIAGRRFYVRRSTSGAMVKDGQALTVKQQIEKWWAEFEKKGEKQVLLEAARAGDDNSAAAAERLVEKYPEAALPAIIGGARRAGEPTEAWNRSALIDFAARLPGERSTGFLLEELAFAPQLEARVAAARALHARKKPEALKAMIAEWRGTSPAGRAESERLRKAIGSGKLDEWHLGDSRGCLINFMVGCGEVEAIRVLVKDASKRPVGRRLQIVDALAGDSSGFFRGYGLLFEERKESPELERAIDAALISFLTDTEEREGMSGSRGDKSYSDPRICDMAAHLLWERDKEKYPFDLEAPLRERDEARMRMANAWRKAHGRPLLKLPRPRTVAKLSDGVARPLCEAIRNARTGAERAGAVAALEAKGLPALAAAEGLLLEIRPDWPARTDAEELAKRLSCIVAEVKTGPNSVEPDEELWKVLRGLEGKPLTAESFVGVLLHFANNQPKGAQGIRLAADRHGDGTGFSVTVTLVGGRVHHGGSQKGWATHQRVRAGKEDLLGSSGSSSLEYCRKRDGYDDLAKAVDGALASPPATPVSVRSSIVRQR